MHVVGAIDGQPLGKSTRQHKDLMTLFGDIYSSWDQPVEDWPEKIAKRADAEIRTVAQLACCGTKLAGRTLLLSRDDSLFNQLGDVSADCVGWLEEKEGREELVEIWQGLERGPESWVYCNASKNGRKGGCN